jgi:hypothetical protein
MIELFKRFAGWVLVREKELVRHLPIFGVSHLSEKELKRFIAHIRWCTAVTKIFPNMYRAKRKNH